MTIGRVLLLSMAALLSIAVIAACGDDREGATGGGDQTAESEGGSGQVSTEEGAMLFSALSCGGCHTLAAADSRGTTGPSLDETLVGKSDAYIRESIEDPNAQIAAGYSEGIMPSFGGRLSAEELESLVIFISRSTAG